MSTEKNYKTSKSIRDRQRIYYHLHKSEILDRDRLKRASPEYKMEKQQYDREKYEKNKETIKLKRKKYYHNNRGKAKNYLLHKKYGISIDDYKRKWDSQNGKCAICNNGPFDIKQMFDKVLVLDHNHNTNQIRGLLCNSCNRALGLFKDNPIITSNATTYLNQWNNL